MRCFNVPQGPLCHNSHTLSTSTNIMEQFNFNAQLQALEQAGVMDIPYGLSAAKAPEAFPSRALPTNNPRFFATPRPSEGLDAFGPSFQSAQQVDDSRRPVNIVLGNCGNESQ